MRAGAFVLVATALTLIFLPALYAAWYREGAARHVLTVAPMVGTAAVAH